MGDESFLAAPTERTKKVLEKVRGLLKEEIARGGVYDVDTKTVITPTAFGPGYVDKELDIIVGLQTDEPLKRACNPFGGMRMVRASCEAYGYQVSEEIEQAFRCHKTHNDGVFSAYSPEIKEARHCGLITGLPDAYGRGRIIGDYRRVALYGVDRLIEEKKKDHLALGKKTLLGEQIRDLEEINDQIYALRDMKKMAAEYGYDISRPAENAREAVQWLYFGYLASIKEQNGAAMSLGRVATVLDIYFERDLAEGGAWRRTGAGVDGRFRPEAAAGAALAHAGLQYAVRRRPDVDHRGRRGHGGRWAAAGHQELFSHAAHAL